MASTIQLQMLKLAQIVDPRDKSDNLFALTTGGGNTGIGTADGDKFPAQKLLDFYNDARMLAAQVISRVPGSRASQEAAENTIRITNAQFSAGVFNKPTGYIFPRLLTDVNGKEIQILSVEEIPFTIGKDSLSIPIVYEETNLFRSAHGNLYIPDASTYIFLYVGVSQFALSDVTGGATTETFSVFYEPVIIQIAAALATSQGLQSALELAKKLIEVGGEIAAQ